MQQRPPTLDEVLPHYLEGLTAAAQRDLSGLPALIAYARLRDELVAAGMRTTIIAKLLPRVKVAVSEGFIKHQSYPEVMRNFAAIMAQLHKAVLAEFGDDGEELFLTMCEDRFALVLPV